MPGTGATFPAAGSHKSRRRVLSPRLGASAPGVGARKVGRAPAPPGRHHAGTMLEYLLLLVGLVRTAVRSQSELVAENLLLRQQFAVLTRPTRRRPRLHSRDRLFWALARRLWRDWRRHLVLVRPETVIRWHRRGWKLFWRWRSRTRVGRPQLNREVRELIATMARDNPRWGSERIRGELLKLGIAISRPTIQRYRGRGPAHPPSQSWRTFLVNHAHLL